MRALEAPRCRRAAAVAVDALPFTLIAMVWFRRRRSVTALDPQPTAPGLSVRRLVAARAAQLAYFTLPVMTIGATPGQLAAGIRVVDSASGARLTVSQAVGRWTVDAVPGFAPSLAIRCWRQRQTEHLRALHAKLDADRDRGTQDDAADDDGNSAVPRYIIKPWPLLAGVGVLAYHLVLGSPVRVRDRISHTTVVKAAELQSFRLSAGARPWFTA
ncbi:MAG: RDD family protein [Acidimicrobiales bacterium]